MMGGGPRKDKKFIQKLMRQIQNGVRELHIVHDKLGTPTYTRDFARNVKLLIEKGKIGLYNMVCQGGTSRLEVARELVSQLGMSGDIKIKEVSSEYFRKKYFVPRPASERLTNTRLEQEDVDVMGDWKKSLNEYLNEYYPSYFE
jgi:dTDP-4-dehydrorhamnose reductase